MTRATPNTRTWAPTPPIDNPSPNAAPNPRLSAIAERIAGLQVILRGHKADLAIIEQEIADLERERWALVVMK